MDGGGFFRRQEEMDSSVIGDAEKFVGSWEASCLVVKVLHLDVTMD